MKHARFVLLIVLAVCLVLTADLLWNVTMALAADGARLWGGLLAELQALLGVQQQGAGGQQQQ